MNRKLLLAFALLLPQAAWCATISGKLVAGGGGDYLQITVQDQHGKRVQAFCTAKCGDWFEQDKDEVSHLRKALVGKKVELVYQSEQNNGRLESYGESDDKLVFVKQVTLLK